MLFPEKEIHLKDGRTAVLRSPTREDAQELVEYMKQTAGETDFLLRTPAECTMTAEEEAAFLQNICDSPASVMILCIVDGKLAGNCQITRMNRLKTKHRGTVAIALLREYWNLGIGTAMFTELIAIAKGWGLRQLELEYTEGNDRARRLYEKMGFHTVGALPNAIRLADGTMLQNFQMVRNME